MNIKKNIDYSELFTQISTAVDSGLDQMELYAEIGHHVALRTEKGAAVAAADYLSKMYPEKAGFSPRNVRRMRDFYLAYKDSPRLMSIAMQLNWTQNVVILESCTEATREWYIRYAKQNGWTKSELVTAIENEEHLGTTVDNSDNLCYSNANDLEEKNSDEAIVCEPREHMQKPHGRDDNEASRKTTWKRAGVPYRICCHQSGGSWATDFSSGVPAVAGAWTALRAEDGKAVRESRLRELRHVDRHGSKESAGYVSNLRWRLCRQNAPATGFYRDSGGHCRSMVHREFRAGLDAGPGGVQRAA